MCTIIVMKTASSLAKAHQVAQLPGRLGAHGEFGPELAKLFQC